MLGQQSHGVTKCTWSFTAEMPFLSWPEDLFLIRRQTFGPVQLLFLFSFFRVKCLSFKTFLEFWGTLSQKINFWYDFELSIVRACLHYFKNIWIIVSLPISHTHTQNVFPTLCAFLEFPFSLIFFSSSINSSSTFFLTKLLFDYSHTSTKLTITVCGTPSFALADCLIA